jgi:hypothetical protein
VLAADTSSGAARSYDSTCTGDGTDVATAALHRTHTHTHMPTANLLNFNVGDGLKFALPNQFWTRLQSKYGTSFFVRDNGEDQVTRLGTSDAPLISPSVCACFYLHTRQL